MYIIFFSFCSVALMLAGAHTLWGALSTHMSGSTSAAKSGPFECGFTCKKKARTPFSLRFFFLIILFLIFDVEVSLLLQLPFQIMENLYKNCLMLFLVVMTLLLGLVEEYRRGVLDWNM